MDLVAVSHGLQQLVNVFAVSLKVGVQAAVLQHLNAVITAVQIACTGSACCDNVEQLRSYKTAITSEGMLYQGYVARALRRDLMEDVFIGHRAVELRIKRLQAELERLEEEQKHWKPIYENLSGQEEPLFTQRFVEADVAERREDYSRSLDIVKEMAEIDEQMSHLNLLWLCEQRKAIEKLKEEMCVKHFYGLQELIAKILRMLVRKRY